MDGGCDTHGRVPLVEVEKRLLGQALIEKGRNFARYAGENKNPEKIRSSIIPPLLQQAHTAQNALTPPLTPNPGPRRSAYLTVTRLGCGNGSALVLTFYRCKSARPIWQQIGNRTGNVRPMPPQCTRLRAAS